MSPKTAADTTQLALEELLSINEQTRTALRRLAALSQPTPEIPEVIRISLHRYHARVTRVAPQRLKKSFTEAGERCMLGISLGSPNMEGAKFEACIQWISEHFSSCALILGDSLFRHTLQVTGTLPATTNWRQEALASGCRFQQEYSPVVEKYQGACTFQWIPLSRIEEYPKFAGYHQAFQQLYQSHQAFRGVVDDFADYYLARVAEREETSAAAEPIADAERERLRGFARSYLLEESALFTCLYEEGWSVFIYPGSIRSFEEIAEGHVPEVPEPLRRSIFVSLAYDKGGLYFASGTDTFYPVRVDEAIERNPDYEVLGALDEEGWHRLLKYTQRKTYRAGDIVMRADDRTNRELFILIKGACEVLKGDWQSGVLQRVALIPCGAVFGEQSFVDSRARTATVAAIEDSETLILGPKRLQQMCKNDADIAAVLLLDIARVLSLRLRGAIH